MFSQESEILRKLRLIEQMKADIVLRVGELFQTAAGGGEKAVAGALAAVVIACYVLGRRLGIEFAVLDEAIVKQLSQNSRKDHDAERWFGDYSEYLRHLRQKE